MIITAPRTNSNKDLLAIQSSTDSNDDKEYYQFKVDKEVISKALEAVSTVATNLGEKIISNLGVTAAAGSAAGAMVKLALVCLQYKELLQ